MGYGGCDEYELYGWVYPGCKKMIPTRGEISGSTKNDKGWYTLCISLMEMCFDDWRVYAAFWGDEYAPFWLGNKEELRQESIDILENEQALLWLAFRNERLVGYQLYLPAAPETDNLLVPDQCIKLAMAATREEEQGRGVGRALTAHGLAAASAAGFTHCIADWRVTNLLSSRFWPRQGFRPVTCRLSRRLDERIAWGHGQPSPSPWLPGKFRP
jgi:ribosomal protein S18 acetylase RimI-like enzyme